MIMNPIKLFKNLMLIVFKTWIQWNISRIDVINMSNVLHKYNINSGSISMILDIVIFI